MSITNEAAYLYVYSKKLISANKKIHSLREEGQKIMRKLGQTSDTAQKQKHHHQSKEAAEKLKKAIEERNTILAKLHRHQVAFAGQLRTESAK